VLGFVVDAWRPGSIHSQGQPCAAVPQQFEHVPAYFHFCCFVLSIQPQQAAVLLVFQLQFIFLQHIDLYSWVPFEIFVNAIDFSPSDLQLGFCLLRKPQVDITPRCSFQSWTSAVGLPCNGL